MSRHTTLRHDSLILKIGRAIDKLGPCTVEQGMEVYGKFQGYPCVTRTAYQDGVFSGYLIEKNGVFSITPKLRKHLDQCEVIEEAPKPKQKPITSVATFPAAAPFKPLSMKHILSALGMRAGSNELRDVKSKHV